MPRVLLFDNMERDQAVEQFFFEHYVNKYIQAIKDHGWDVQDDTLRAYRFILEGLSVMALSVHPTSANKLRAELMVIISCVLVQLKELNMEESLDHLSEDKRLEICHDIKTLQTAVQDIIRYIPSLKFRAICEKCLFQIDALKLYFQCEQDISQPEVDLDLSALNQLWSVLRELVLEASKFIENPSECSCQLLRKMNGENTEERLSRLSDLQEIMGGALEESDELQEITALEEKCKQIKMRRQYSSDSSQEQRTRHGLKQMENVSLTSTPKKSSVVSAQGQTVKKKADVSESDSGSESGDQNSADKKKYPVLAHVQPKWSLLSFGDSRKPPSHLMGKRGKWLLNEEEDFIVKTLEIGEGKWAEIKDAMKSARSSVQLKDKWRLIALSRVTKVARQYGLTYNGSKKPT